MFGQREQTDFDPYSEPEQNVAFLQKMKANKEPYTDNVSGTEFIVYPEVFAPKYDELFCTENFIKNMPSPYKKKVLDIGTGESVWFLSCNALLFTPKFKN